MQILVCPFVDLESAPQFPALIREYADECAIAGLPRPNPDLPAYRRMCAGGAMHTIVAKVDDEVVGFVMMICIPLPHYSVPVAVSESLFVASAHRASGAGLALIREAERLAQGLGALGLLISAPVDGRLADVLLRKPDYRPTNLAFFKGLA